MASNIATLPSFPPILAQLGVNRYVLQGLINYNPDSGAESVIDLPGVAEYVAQLRDVCREVGVELVCTIPQRLESQIRGDPQVLSAYYQHNTEETDHTKMCNLAWEMPYIDKDGKVYPCCYAAAESIEILGDLHSERLEDIWLGQRYQRFRADILDGRTTPTVCRSCVAVPLGQHQFRLYAAKLLLNESILHGPTQLRLVVQNTGSRTWTQADLIQIGTAYPRDHASAFANSDWLGFNRIASLADERAEDAAQGPNQLRSLPPALDHPQRRPGAGDAGQPDVERGTHAQLLDRGGVYADLYRRQFRDEAIVSNN
jgi:radical SAM protein with 4Fe4S-binding SPASM domain